MRVVSTISAYANLSNQGNVGLKNLAGTTVHLAYIRVEPKEGRRLEAGDARFDIS
jgi:1,4-dihydroxy-2-naphthoyl-CoA synthase